MSRPDSDIAANPGAGTSSPGGQMQIPTDRTARRDTPNRDGISMRSLRRSTRLSVYLYILAHYKGSDEQREFVAYFQSRLNLAEIQSALKFMHRLTTDPRTRARMRIPESQEGALRLIPAMRSRPINREQRRIGVGYRDKGSLPSRSKPDWDKNNSLWVGYTSMQEETRSWDLTILWDPPESTKEPDLGSAAAGGTPQVLSSIVNPNGLKLEKLDSKSWKISLPEP